MTVDQGRRAVAVDAALYAAGVVFAAVTAGQSTLAPHRAWGAIAWVGYAVAALAAVGQLVAARRWTAAVSRGALVAATWVAVAVVPVLVEAAQRAGGRTDRAQDEVIVVEAGAARVLRTGTPYLDRDVIATLPSDQWLTSYTPYQPWMPVFGLPRAVFGVAWWTDARVWFAVATGGLLVLGLGLLRRTGAGDAALVRVAQALTVLPIAALTLSTGGPDLPVLGLCLVAFACAARGNALATGLAVGLACGMKIHAWPVAVVLFAWAAANGRRSALRYAGPAFGLPVLALIPALVIDADAFYENVVQYPLLNRGLFSTPAESPLPGRLLMLGLGAPGRLLAGGLLLAVGIAIAVRLLRRPPRKVAEAAALCAIGTGAAILLSPYTRFGYLIYPVALAMWIPALRAGRRVVPSEPVYHSRAAATERTQGE